MHWKTLRFRLALWTALTVMLTAAVVLLALRQGVRWALLHEMDQILTEDIEEVTLALRELSETDFEQLTEVLNRKAIGHRHHEWFVQLVGPDQKLVWSSLDASQAEIPFANDPRSTPYTVGNRRLIERNLQPSATIETPLHQSETSPETSLGSLESPREVVTIRVAVALTLLNQDIAKIDRLVLLLVGSVLLLAPLIGYTLAGKVAGWIGSIIQTASRLRPDHLEERLSIRGTGDELDQLAATINGLLDRIAEFLKQKQDFLADSAHELRTPLAAIRSSVEVALTSRRSPAEYEELLENILEQGTALERLVNQLLLISETEVEQFSTHEMQVPLDLLVQQSVDMISAVAESRGIALKTRISAGVVVRGRQHLLRQLVNNLIDNSLKYTPSGGCVEVSLESDDDHQMAVLTVADTGIGIDPEDLPHVFDRFFRAGKRWPRATVEFSKTHTFEAETVSGTGLGLSICQAVATAHHGEIFCESQPGQGTRMVVRLPLSGEISKPLAVPAASSN